jgi:hypothetical protein
MRPAVNHNEIRRETKVKIKESKRRWKQNVVFVQNPDFSPSLRNDNAQENPGTNPITFFHKFTCTRRYLKVNLSASAAKSYKKLRALVIWDLKLVRQSHEANIRGGGRIVHVVFNYLSRSLL